MRCAKHMNYITNWFACSICGEPTTFKRTTDDGYHHGYCKRCKKVVRLDVAYGEVSPDNKQDGMSTKLTLPSPCE